MNVCSLLVSADNNLTKYVIAAVLYVPWLVRYGIRRISLFSRHGSEAIPPQSSLIRSLLCLREAMSPGFRWLKAEFCTDVRCGGGVEFGDRIRLRDSSSSTPRELANISRYDDYSCSFAAWRTRIERTSQLLYRCTRSPSPFTAHRVAVCYSRPTALPSAKSNSTLSCRASHDRTIFYSVPK